MIEMTNAKTEVHHKEVKLLASYRLSGTGKADPKIKHMINDWRRGRN